MARSTRLSLSEATKKGSTKAPPEQASAAETKKASVRSEDGDSVLDTIEVKKGSNTALFVVVGIAVVAVIILVFLFFGGSNNSEGAGETGVETEESDTNTGSDKTADADEEEPVVSDSNTQSGNSTGLGTQNFLESTTMQNGSVLTDPDMYLEDLYGLTTRVDYTVEKISNVADFVSYEKHRGTWGGGLELYWLDAEYKNQHYVVQVPFEYYKELDDVGIVPVKMEVLTIKGSAEGETLTVISYMCLDAETLKDILKQQSK